MPNDQSRTIDIYIRINKFVIKTLVYYRSINKDLVSLEIVKQAIRSTCSIGANANEADGTLTKNEFLHTFSIARREAKETNYWLKLLGDLNPELKPKMIELVNECNEIVAILSKIILVTRNKTK